MFGYLSKFCSIICLRKTSRELGYHPSSTHCLAHFIQCDCWFTHKFLPECIGAPFWTFLMYSWISLSNHLLITLWSRFYRWKLLDFTVIVTHCKKNRPNDNPVILCWQTCPLWFGSASFAWAASSGFHWQVCLIV